MGQILIGTCSWTDPTLLQSGRFYPEEAKTAEARLRFYATQFNLVEVDSTYYSMPSERTARLWVERTPAQFTFDVKAFRLFTQHPTQAKVLPSDLRQTLPDQLAEKPNLYLKDLDPALVTDLWERFEAALLPLDSTGKLGVVLFQFPPWFHPGSAQREYMLSCRERLPQYRVAIEFRNNAWLNEVNEESTLAFLRDHDLPFVCVDEPQGFRSSVPPIAETTSDIGLIRFHGRNAETWEKKNIKPSDRFNYRYSQEELSEWVPRIESLSVQAKQLHVLFNTNHEDQGMVNARQLRFMLD